MELDKTEYKIRKLDDEFTPLKRHCFIVEMKDDFELFKLDMASVVKNLNSFVPLNKSATIKVADGRIIIYEFDKPVRMRIKSYLRNDCTINRVKFGELYNYFTVFDNLEKIELSR